MRNIYIYMNIYAFENSLWNYIYICINMYICIRAFSMRRYIHMYIYSYICIWESSMRRYIHMYTNMIYMHLRILYATIYTYVYLYMYAFKNSLWDDTYICINIYVCIWEFSMWRYIQMYIRIHMHLRHTHTHTYVPEFYSTTTIICNSIKSTRNKYSTHKTLLRTNP